MNLDITKIHLFIFLQQIPRTRPAMINKKQD